MTPSDISLLREIQAMEDLIDLLYYENYIEDWYSEINQDLSSKYKDKIEVLDIGYNKLVNLLQA